MNSNQVYPKHIYEPIRVKIATSYVKHEFRKLLWRVPEKNWKVIDRDISSWMTSPQLATPRDFWNGFHGISMGFKLKLGLVYLITAENIKWSKKEYPVEKLWFGVDLKQTNVVGKGKLPAKKLVDFYLKPENKKIKQEQLEFTLKLSKETAPRDKQPVIAIQTLKDDKAVYSVHDGNRRLAKAILEEKEKISAFLGEYSSSEKFPMNYWIPTSILMDVLFFAREAYKQEDKKLFEKYMAILKDMLSKSESAVYEMKERALTSQQPFRNDVLKSLGLLK